MSKTTCLCLNKHTMYICCWRLVLRGLVQRERESVCQRTEPVEVSYKGPPQLCRQTGNCRAFSQFHMAPSVSSTRALSFSTSLKPTKTAPCFSSYLPTPCTNLTTTTDLSSEPTFFVYSYFPPAGPRVGLSC